MPPATFVMILSVAIIVCVVDPTFADSINLTFDAALKPISDYIVRANETVLTLAASSYVHHTPTLAAVLPKFLHAAHLSILMPAYVIDLFMKFVVVGLSYMHEFVHQIIFYGTSPALSHLLYGIFDLCIYALLFTTPVVVLYCARLMPEPVFQLDSEDDLINTPLPRPVMRRKPIPTLEASRKRDLGQRLRATRNAKHQKPQTTQAQSTIQPRTLDESATNASAHVVCVPGSVVVEPEPTEDTTNISPTETETGVEEDAYSTPASSEPEGDAPFMAVFTPPDSSDLPSTPASTLPAPVMLSIPPATPTSDWTSEGPANNEPTLVDSSLEPTFDDATNTQTPAKSYSSLAATGLASSYVLSEDDLALPIQATAHTSTTTAPVFMDSPSPTRAPISTFSAPLSQTPAPTFATENSGTMTKGDTLNVNAEGLESLFSLHVPFSLDHIILLPGVNTPTEPVLTDDPEVGVRASVEQQQDVVYPTSNFTMEFLAAPAMTDSIEVTLTDVHSNTLVDLLLWNDPQLAAASAFACTDGLTSTFKVPEPVHYADLAVTSDAVEQLAMDIVSSQVPIQGYVEELLGAIDPNGDLTIESLAAPDIVAFVEAALFDMNAEIYTGAVDPSIWDDPTSTFGSGPSNPGDLIAVFGTYEQAHFQQSATLDAVSGCSETNSAPTLQQDLQGLDGLWASLGINATAPSESDEGIALDAMFVHSSVPETGIPSIPNPGALAMPGDPTMCTTIEEILNLCLTPNVSLEPVSLTADAIMDQPSFDLAGLAFGTTADALMTTSFATLMESVPEATGDAQVDWLFMMPEQGSLEAADVYNPVAPSSSKPPLQYKATFMDPDMPMTDEQCLAQLSELCHGMSAPAGFDPSFDLSAALDGLLLEISALSPTSPLSPLEPQPEVPLAPMGPATPDSVPGRPGFQDWVNFGMIFDSAALDENEDGSGADSEPPTTPHSVPMDVDQSPEIEGYRAMDICEQKTVCPSDILVVGTQIRRTVFKL